MKRRKIKGFAGPVPTAFVKDAVFRAACGLARRRARKRPRRLHRKVGKGLERLQMVSTMRLAAASGRIGA